MREAMARVDIDDAFWSPRLKANRERSLFRQWERCEERGTIDNFRIAAGLKQGPRRGFFYTDSDLHKWADAAARALRTHPDPRLRGHLDEYARLMGLCQEPDGYLFTWNQILFPGTRWKNLQIEHELYCHGHFIEAGIAHHEATGEDTLLLCARRAADLVVREFLHAPPIRTSGHQEIEIALLRLYRLTGCADYRETARALLERRGRALFFGPRFLGQALSQKARSRAAARRQPGGTAEGFQVGENLTREEPRFIMLRFLASVLSGSYNQQHAPLRRQAEPRGHAVRWAYMMCAAAMLQRETADASLLRMMEEAWRRLAAVKMYVTGGMGSLPVMEGFGRPYELDNRFSYSETCAAIGSVLWNREMSLATGDARYADTVEWQLYNAVAVGVSLAGDAWFYRNPLSSPGGLARRDWYATACCPSNVSRLLADLDRLLYARDPQGLRVEQYVSGCAVFDDGLRLRAASSLPWEGSVEMEVSAPAALTLRLRVPGWTDRASVRVGTAAPRVSTHAPPALFGPGRFEGAHYIDVELPAGASGVRCDFSLPIIPCTADPRVRADRGRVAVTRGPLAYCAESVDNPGRDLPRMVVEPSSLRFAREDVMIHGCGVISGLCDDGGPVRLVPYALWGNRGASAMEVWLRDR